MDAPDIVITGEVRNRARHAQDAGIAARRKTHHLCRLCQQLASGIIGRTDFCQQIAVNFGIGSKPGLRIAVGLPLPRGANPRAHLRRSFRRWR